MDPLPEHDFVRGASWRSQEVLGRVRRNDPALKELTIVQQFDECWFTPFAEPKRQMILQAFDAISTNSSLKILNIEGDIGFLFSLDEKDRMKRALSLNTSLKHIRLEGHFHSGVTKVIDIVMVSPNLETLTVQSNMEFDPCRLFTKAFRDNQTIKTLIVRCNSISRDGAVSFVKRLPHAHSLEAIAFDFCGIDDGSAATIIRTLCRKHLKKLSLAGNKITQEGCERIVQTLKENEHSFTELDLFRDYENSWWQNKTQLEIDLLTWSNRLQFEKETWVDRFLEQDNPTKELLFLALDRTKKVDSIPSLALEERATKVDSIQISKPPNMLFHLIKEKPDLIARATHDGH